MIPLIAGALLALAITASLFGLQQTLPRPSGGNRTAIDAYHVLAQTNIALSLERIDSRPLVTAACRPRRHNRILIATSSGHRLLVSNGKVKQIRPLRRLAHEQILAESSLAGCVDPLYTGLAARLINGRPVFRGNTTFASRPAIRLQVGADAPPVYLIVARATLTPLAIEFASHQRTGSSRLILRRSTPARRRR